jgi:proteasome assembly chaperone (PAC2) family protein
VDPLQWQDELPELRSPMLVCAFEGWNDAASAATTALEAAAMALDAEVVARIDPEEFFDFQVSRPTIRLVEGQSRRIDWPANTLLAATAPTAERDLALLTGNEPNMRWRTFAETIVSAAKRLEVEMVVTLGALIADVAHTRPVPITGLASDPDLVERLGLSRSSYEGPTGIVGVLHDACRQQGMTSASLWAAVPHYVATVPNPKAALALLRRLEGLTGVATEASELEEAGERFSAQIDQAVAANPEVEELVGRLEREQEEAAFTEGADVPTGDAIAHELQRFLRQRDETENSGS